jgi:hypothetical protein
MHSDGGDGKGRGWDVNLKNFQEDQEVWIGESGFFCATLYTVSVSPDTEVVYPFSVDTEMVGTPFIVVWL